MLADGGLFVLVSTTPPDGGTVSTTISATFSAPPDSASTNLARLSLIETYAGATVPSTASLNGANTIQLSPTNGLPRASTIELRIANTLTSGPATFAGQSTFFRTSALRPTFPTSSLPRTGVSDVTAAYDARGLAHYLWSSGTTVYVMEPATTPTVLNFTSGSSPAIEIALDAAGNGKAVAAWVEGMSTNRNVRASIFSGPWSSSMPLETFTGNAAAPSVAVEPQGNARVVWQQTIDGGVFVASACLVNGTWLPQEQLSAQPGATTPRVVTDDLGNALLAWIEQGTLKVRLGALTGVLGAEESLTPVSDNAGEFDVAMNANGAAVIAWKHDSSLTLTTRVGTQWVHHDVGVGYSPSVGIDSLGVATAVWWDGVDNWVTRGTGMTWSTPARLNTVGRTVRPARVAVAGPSAFAAWIQLNTASTPSTYVMVGSIFAFDAWGTPTSFGGSTANFPMKAASAPNGNGVVLWADGTSFDLIQVN